MNRTIFTFLLIASTHLFAQQSIDSLPVVFHTDFERVNFEKVYNGNEDNFVQALLSIDSTVSFNKAKKVEGILNDFLVDIKKKADSYNSKKKVKFIFNKIHDRFFKKYELDAYFSDAFTSGKYNCVSGTALYAHAFDYLNVPYQIKETPTHVFIVAYPAEFNIYVETTLPGKAGSFAPSESLVRKAVDDLVELKLIAKEQVNTVGYNKAYNDYFYGNENITKKDLIGIQYYNKAVFLLNDNNYSEAYENMSKSQLIYQNKKARLFNEAILAMLIEQASFKKVEDFSLLTEYAKDGNELDYIKYKIENLISDTSWADSDLTIMEKSLSAMDSVDIKNSLLEAFYSSLARKSHKMQNTKRAMEYAHKVYGVNDQNVDAKNYIAGIEIDRLAQKNLTASRLDDLGNLITKYPFLQDFDIYKRYTVFLYSFLVANEFHNNRGAQGSEYLVVLEQFLNADGDNEIGFNQQSIGGAYAAVGAYYYRKGQKENAKKFLKRGLEYSPDNENIKRKLKLMQNSY
nr:hypothetical protein [uncultured Allomuricauda sp.]